MDGGVLQHWTPSRTFYERIYWKAEWEREERSFFGRQQRPKQK